MTGPNVHWTHALTIVAAVSLTAAGISVATDRTSKPQPGQTAPPDPWEWCRLAAAHPHHGFAFEVCEPLSPGYVHPESVYPSDFDTDGCVILHRENRRYCPTEADHA